MKMTRSDYLAMSACYSMVAALFVMVLFPAETVAFIVGLVP